MLTLTISLLVSAFLLGPGLLFRWAIGLAVEPKNLILSRGEEITRALVWVTPPLLLSVVWAIAWGNLPAMASVHNVASVFRGASNADDPVFLDSLHRLFWVNLCVLWRLYALTALYTLLVLLVLRHYQRLGTYRWGKWLIKFALVTSPPISKWFFYLNSRFTPSADLELHLDVLTKGGTLYQGRIAEFTLETSGTLQSVALASPRRFRRSDFEARRQAWPGVRAEDYWREIPDNLFLIAGSDIANINLRYVETQTVPASASGAQRDALLKLIDKTERM